VTQIVAAGAVVARAAGADCEVLLVHRTKHEDWSFPKGKVDADEPLVATAVREVAEETGLDIRLGPPLDTQGYQVAEGSKTVHYWVGELVGGDDVDGYEPNAEVDVVAWVPIRDAGRRLTYARDRQTLNRFRRAARHTVPLILLRHAKAVSRARWDGEDCHRPLSIAGAEQAERLVPLLQAYGVQRVLSSSAERCWTTVAPYADLADVELEVTDRLSEEHATPRSVTRLLEGLCANEEPTVLVTHRPVLPLLLDALGAPPRKLESGGLLVLHHRATDLAAVAAVEHHSP
jgi:8-oxo-dGTP diphosphatase